MPLIKFVTLCVLFDTVLTLLHSEKPKLHTILAFQSAIGIKVKIELDQLANLLTDEYGNFDINCTKFE